MEIPKLIAGKGVPDLDYGLWIILHYKDKVLKT